MEEGKKCGHMNTQWYNEDIALKTGGFEKCH